MSGERRTDISFRMLDARDNTPVRYERVNAETGEEVPWKEIVKANWMRASIRGSSSGIYPVFQRVAAPLAATLSGA